MFEKWFKKTDEAGKVGEKTISSGKEGSVVCDGDTCCFVPKSTKTEGRDLIAEKGSNIIKLEDGDRDTLKSITDSPKGSIIRYTASWCKPCKKLEPHFFELAEKYKQVIFATIDVDENADIAGENFVVALPAFHIYQSGVQMEKSNCNDQEGLARLISKHFS